MQSPSKVLRVNAWLKQHRPALTKVDRRDIALDFDLAVWDVLRWADARSEETDEVDAPDRRKRKPTMTVKRYPDLYSLLGIDAPDVDAEPEMSPEDVRDTARELLNNPDRLKAFLAPKGQ